MSTNTTHFSLIKPGVASPTDQDLWGGMLNDDLDDIDSIMWSALNFVHSDQITSFSVTTADYKKLFLCDATGGAITVTLPAASTVYDGFTIAVKRMNAGANAVTIDGDGSETIDGAATLALSNQYDYAVLVCDNSEWLIVSGAPRQATTTVKGIVELATDAEAKAGTDTERVITPSNLAFVFSDDADIVADGYYTLPGGLIMQWGRYDSNLSFGTSTTITFPLAFPATVFNINITPKGSISSGGEFFALPAANVSLTEFTTGSNGTSYVDGFYWFAIGI